MMKMNLLIAILVSLSGLLGCKAKEKAVNVSYAGAPAIIYKTRADYSQNVAVTLSADKSKIVSYPSPKDVYMNGSIAYPTALSKGYLLDNRGVSTNTAFLRITYEQYSKLTDAPRLEEMYNQIIDKDPITEMYNLGDRARFKDATIEINHIIENKQLKEYKKLK